MQKRRVFFFASTLALMTATVAGAVAAGLGGAAARPPYGTWAPGVAGNVGAMNRLAQPVSPPAALADSVAYSASRTGGDPGAARQSLRRLHSDLGVGRNAIWAFSPDRRAICLVVWQRTTACPTSTGTPHPGVLWVLNGGYPSVIEGKAVDVPSSLAGVVTDDVRAVTVSSNGQETPIEIVNNSFFHELAEPTGGEAWTIELRVSYNDGRSVVIPVGDPRPES